MNRAQIKRLQQAGFAVGDAREFLQLSAEEAALIELKVRLVEMLRRLRQERGVTQHELAARIGSSQSRVAKMEAGVPDVSLDLLCKALFALGASPKQIGQGILRTRAA